MPLIWIAALAAQAANDARPLPPPASTPIEHAWHNQQIFIAPSGEPFRAARGEPYPVAQWFAQADANHDGKLTEAEFTADFMRFFTVLDLDHDGEISAAEMARYEDTVAPEVHAPTFNGQFGGPQPDDGGDDRLGERAHAAQAEPIQGAARFDLLGIPEPVASMDIELHGRVSQRQALEAAAERFDALDTTHRGYLTLDQLPQTFVQGHKLDRPEGRRGSGGGHHRGGGRGRDGEGSHGGDAPSGGFGS